MFNFKCKPSRFIWLWVALLALAASAACAEMRAYEMTGSAVEATGSAAEKVSAYGKTDVSLHAADDYTTTVYNYETGAESGLYGPEIDWSGQYYYLKKNSAKTVSYIFQNYAPNNRTNPFITINGNVQTFNVTSDAGASYLYYKMEGEDAIYRLPLVKGASSPERKTFSFDGTDFAFKSFTLAQDPNQFLLYSNIDSNLKVRIGLFSFTGGTSPIRAWTGALPQAWKDNFQPLTVDNSGYDIVFEASTGKLWLIAERTWTNTARWGKGNNPWWFFSGSIAGSGDLVSYSPSSEIPGYDDGNLKILFIGRYGRTVREYNGSLPDETLSIREFDAASKQFKAGALTTYKENGAEKPIDNFFSQSGGSGGIYSSGFSLDGQGNLYLGWSKQTSSVVDWQRMAIFAPAQASQIGTPAPDPSANGTVFEPGKIVLKSSKPSMPSGTTITGSRWEIYRAGGSTPVYTGKNNGDSNTHTVSITLPEGGYLWRVAYDWVRSGAETVTGSTKWSPEAPITVKVSDPTQNPATPAYNGGAKRSGGCDAGASGAVWALVLASGWMLAKGRKK